MNSRMCSEGFVFEWGFGGWNGFILFSFILFRKKIYNLLRCIYCTGRKNFVEGGFWQVGYESKGFFLKNLFALNYDEIGG